jgi:hypothetical protein
MSTGDEKIFFGKENVCPAAALASQKEVEPTAGFVSRALAPACQA